MGGQLHRGLRRERGHQLPPNTQNGAYLLDCVDKGRKVVFLGYGIPELWEERAAMAHEWQRKNKHNFPVQKPKKVCGRLFYGPAVPTVW